MVLYAASSSLKFLSLVCLRVSEPDVNRPFRIPLETAPLACKPVLLRFLAIESQLWELIAVWLTYSWSVQVTWLFR